jgi:hypothetical protein
MVHSYQNGGSAKQQYQQIAQFESCFFFTPYYRCRNSKHRQQCHRSVKPKVFARNYSITQIAAVRENCGKNNHYKKTEQYV